MKIYVTTSDKYVYMIPTYAYLFNKYWPNQDVNVLCFNLPSQPLPSNFTAVSLGKQNHFAPRDWSGPLRNFLVNCPEEYFVFTLEDELLLGPVDQHKIDILEKEVREGRAQKAIIHNLCNRMCTEKYMDDIWLIPQNMRYRLTLHPSIWNKNYLLKYLTPGMMPQRFELAKDAAAQNDGAVIISYDGPHIFSCQGIHYQGRRRVIGDFKDYLICEEDTRLVQELLDYHVD